MNKEEEEAPLEDPCVRQNHLARERHVTQFEEQRVANASRRAARRVLHSDVQIAADVSQRAAWKVARNDAQITAGAQSMGSSESCT